MESRTINAPEPKHPIPSRGSVLCVFEDAATVAEYEPKIAGVGFTLLRARHGMHGYWLAVTAQPDVIVTDVATHEKDAQYLLGCLARNHKTQNIPVIAIVEPTSDQKKPQLSCLHSVSTCLLKGTPSDELVTWIDKQIDRRPAVTAVPPDELSRFDAFFADLGHSNVRPHWSNSRVMNALDSEPAAQAEPRADYIIDEPHTDTSQPGRRPIGRRTQRPSTAVVASQRQNPAEVPAREHRPHKAPARYVDES